MRSIVIVAAAAAALLAVGCGNSGRLEGELAAANARIGSLDSTVTGTQTELMSTRQRADSLAKALRTSLAAVDSLSGATDRLSNRLYATRTRLEKSLDSLRGVLQAAEELTASLDTRLNDAQADIGALQQRADGLGSERDNLQIERDSLFAFVDAVRPWYDYYRSQSQRNWLKKLFGAGNAEKPNDPEPSFDVTPPAPDLEAQQP